MIEEIRGLGVRHIEVGYDLTVDLVPGLTETVKHGTISVTSVHAYCPVPAGAPWGSPELFTPASLNPKTRDAALKHLKDTILFAAGLGAKTVIIHGGRVDMDSMSARLADLAIQDRQFSPEYESIGTKLMLQREKKAPKHTAVMKTFFEQILPTANETGINLAIEITPMLESVPSEIELSALLTGIGSPRLKYWHDIGHGQVRQNLGSISVVRWLEKLQPHLAGMHVHDTAKPAFDHIAPGKGSIDFKALKRFTGPDMPAVFEPYPGMPAEELLAGMAYVAECWQEDWQELRKPAINGITPP